MIFARPKPQLSAEPRNGLLLRGLDGTNPLGFLAALGLFRVLHEASGSEDLRMSWAAAERDVGSRPSPVVRLDARRGRASLPR